MDEETENPKKRYTKTLLVSLGLHGALLLVLSVAGPQLAWASRHRDRAEAEMEPIPITWVFTQDGQEGVPGAAGGKRVQETPALAKGAPGGENTPTPPPEPDRTQPHGSPEPIPSPIADPAVEHRPGTVPVERAATSGPPTDQPTDEPGRAKGAENGMSGAPNGKDANTSGEQAAGGGPSRGAGYGGPGFNGPARSKQAENEGWHGSVRVNVRIGPGGQPLGASVVGSSGIGGLDADCIRRVMSAPASAFVPALDHGAPVEGAVAVTCDFPAVQ